MGIAIHNIAASDEPTGNNLVDALRGTAKGFLGTTVIAGDLVIPFVAGGFLYIGAVAVLPRCVYRSCTVVTTLTQAAVCWKIARAASRHCARYVLPLRW